MQTGIAGGMAWSFMDYQLDVGLGAKIVQRSGIDTKQHVFDAAIVEITEDKKTTKLQNKFSNKAAFAPDVGATYHFDSVHNMEPKVAVSLQNIGGLDFEGAGKVPMTMNIGVSTEGIVLTIGMAVDANVLIFQRIREELKRTENPRAAIQEGFGKAFRTILDANITTLFAALALLQFGTGPIKGFAVTLSIGIIASMFTAIVVTRFFFDIVYLRKTKLHKLSI